MNKIELKRKIRIHFTNIKTFAKLLGVKTTAIYSALAKNGKLPDYYYIIFELADKCKELTDYIKKKEGVKMSIFPSYEPYLNDGCDDDEDLDNSYDKELINDSNREQEAFENE